ncbi:hypothetical protein GCM10023093_22330 [Nemorincola caseinilytica]|uniref:T9SS C-terminal target domain-containing protein n=1 Tax=Nemorincola caseinilytica TaxID=2054315 RepID=A0ABP8NJY0_9BACT
MIKKVLFYLLAIVSGASAVSARDTKNAILSAHTRMYLNNVAKAGNDGKPMDGYVYKMIEGRMYISAFVKVGADVDEAALNTLGVYIGTRAGNIWTVQIPADKVTAFTKVAGIANIDLDAPITPLLDNAKKTTRADSAQKGINLPMPFTGKNVVVGIIDAGFDFDHPTLYDTTHTLYRVRRVWTQKLTGTPPAGFSYGREMTDPYVMRSVGYDTAITTHGTHVAGIAAGSGYSSPSSKYRGMAYESDMVFVGIMPPPGQWAVAGATDIIDGMNYIFTYAASVFKPAIANLSWGSSIGPHDGHSLFSQACDALTGPGRIFACSAGNCGEDSLHLRKTFTATNTSVSTFVTFDPQLDTTDRKTWIDVWGDTGRTFCLNIKLYDGVNAIDSTGPICISDTVHDYVLTGSDGDPCHITISMTPTEYNGKPHAFVYLHSLVPDNICLSATATSGTIDMWEGFLIPPTGYYGELKKLGYAWAVDGDNRMTVSDISSSFSAISVGAYVSKGSFTNIGGTFLSYGVTSGRIAPFSSLGPLPDGRIKPDITGPGMALASAISSYDTSYTPLNENYIYVISKSTIDGRVYPYAMAAGTSMSCPAVAGIIAMMLQLNSTLTPDSVKNILARTAIVDANTGTIPPAGTNTWGHGKANAYKALRDMAAQLTVQNTLAEDPMDCLLYPNPTNGTFTLVYNNTTMAKTVTVTVMDMTGRSIHTQTMQAANGYNVFNINTGDVPKGLYLTRISCGEKANVIKTMIER